MMMTILADHTWVPALPDWVGELNPLLVTIGLFGGVLVLWQLVIQTFEPRKRWQKFKARNQGSEEEE